MKRVITTLLIIAMVLSMVPFASAAEVGTYGVNVTAKVSSTDANVVEVDVKLDAYKELYGMTFSLEYDSTKLQYVSHVAGGLLQKLNAYVNPTTGVVFVSSAGINPVSSDVEETVLSLKFNIIGTGATEITVPTSQIDMPYGEDLDSAEDISGTHTAGLYLGNTIVLDTSSVEPVKYKSPAGAVTGDGVSVVSAEWKPHVSYPGTFEAGTTYELI